MMSKIYTIIDFETTGLNLDPKNPDQITEMAALKIDETGREIASFHTFVKLTEGRKPSKFAKVTEEDCENGMDEVEALLFLDTFSHGTTLVAQSAPFDLSFLDWQPMNFICTRALTFMVEPKGTNPSLAPTCERHGIKLKDHHRAMSDVKATKEVLLLMVEKAKEEGIENYENAVVDFIERPINFRPKFSNVFKEVE
jgi:DNA polymerase III subunit epsilon